MLAIKRLLKTALRSIMRNRMRSLLTALGIIIGVSAVIIMVAIGRGSEKRIQENFSSLGTNLLMVFPGSSKSGGVSKGASSFTKFTFEDVEKLKKEGTYIGGVSPIVRASAQIIGGVSNWSTQVYGVSPDYFTIRKWELESGELFTDRDVKSNRKVVLLGKTVAKELFPNESPIGKQVRIRSTPFVVIGVLKAKGQGGMGNDQDDMVMAPSTTVFYRLKGGQFIDMLNVSAVSDKKMEEAQKEIETILREAHRLTGNEENDFTVRNPSEISEMATSSAQTMTLLLGAIAGVSLVVGGIGIMNIMLVSVTERTREIGIRMSVGARERDVLAQFLTEAGVLSLSAGIVGILLGVSVSIVIDKFTSLNASISVGMMFLAFAFSAAVGVFFGYYPARKAASMNPIEALRYE